MNAINGLDPGQYGDYDDMFNSGNDNYPWLAIDLGFLYKVFFLYIHRKLTALECVMCRSQGCQWLNELVAALNALLTSTSEWAWAVLIPL